MNQNWFWLLKFTQKNEKSGWHLDVSTQAATSPMCVCVWGGYFMCSPYRDVAWLTGCERQKISIWLHRLSKRLMLFCINCTSAGFLFSMNKWDIILFSSNLCALPAYLFSPKKSLALLLFWHCLHLIFNIISQGSYISLYVGFRKENIQNISYQQVNSKCWIRCMDYQILLRFQ